MPTLIQAAIWNVKSEVGYDRSRITDLTNFTNLLKWQEKLKLLGDVVGLANKALPTPENLPQHTQVLRLFLAPEYLFAETCNRHVVDYETRGHIVMGLERLSATVPDMLLMPGTVAYFKPLVDTKLEKQKFKVDSTRESRLVTYAGCYEIGKEKATYIAHNTAYAFYGGQKVFKYRKMFDCGELNPQDHAVKKVVVFAKGERLGVYDFDKAGSALQIGVEICADHDSGALSNGNAKDLDLQIVLSASTGLREKHAVLREGGCLFHCDAAANAANGRHRAFQQVKGKLVDLRDMGDLVSPSERIDPLDRQELAWLKSRSEKLDTGFEKGLGKALNVATTQGKPTKEQLKQQVRKRFDPYLESRGGAVHFYEATIP